MSRGGNEKLWRGGRDGVDCVSLQGRGKSSGSWEVMMLFLLECRGFKILIAGSVRAAPG